ncbi:MAG TPA: DUF2339 domain-containing protein, partial [Flavobacteriales bacterium]|nr:DUF2339 domain-containing protein [Flavobacteriales bacterium]
IGLGIGALLIFFAHRLREKFRAFSSVLVGGGIAVFYTTIYFAYHRFELIGQAPAFAIMVGITALAVALTLGYDRRELAVISLLGGFAAPFLAANGDGNHRVLFSYLLILDVGMLVLANYKKWHIINVLSFALTTIILVAWSVTDYTEFWFVRPSLEAFAFAAAFFVVFFAMNLRYNLKHKQAFSALDHTLLLANTGAFYGVGLHFLSDMDLRVTGLFTALLGVYYLAFALYFHKREGIPRPLKLLLIGLVLTFISLAAPVQLQGSHITLFWAAEAVLLLWFAHRTDLKLVERGSFIVALLMLISLGMDMGKVYGWGRSENMHWLLNKGWITGMCPVASLTASVLLLRRVDGSITIALGASRSALKVLLALLAALVLYVTNLFELTYQLGVGHGGTVVHQAQL